MDFEFWNNCWVKPTQPFHLTKPHHFLTEYFDQYFADKERVLLPLCGKTQDLNFLAQNGINVIGVEFNPRAVQSFFADSKLTPEVTSFDNKTRYQTSSIEVWMADFFYINQDDIGQFQAIFDRAALVALPPKMRPDYAKHLISFLAPQGRLLLVTMDYDVEQMLGPPFYIDKAEIEELFPNTEIKQLARTSIIQSHPRWRELELSRLDEVLYEIQLKTM